MPSMRAVSFGLAAVLVLAACGKVLPDPTGGQPVSALVLRYDPQDGAYRLIRGEIRTLRNLRTLEGHAARIRGGADVYYDVAELVRENPQTREELEKLVYRSPPAEVDLAYFVSDGVVHPEDFHGLNLLTTYYNFERAQTFFGALDPEAELAELDVLYFPRVREDAGGNIIERQDNAYWDPILRQFAILPFDSLDALPLGMNAGVVTHEFSHAVFTAKAFPEDTVGTWLLTEYTGDPSQWSRTMKWHRAFDEGLADLMAALAMGDPNFLRKSVPETAEARRLDPPEPRCFTNELRTAFDERSYDTFDPYPIGTIVAAALWQAWNALPNRELRREPFARGLVAGMGEVGAMLKLERDRADVSDYVEAFAKHLVPDVKDRACGLLLDRLRLTESAVPSCAAATPPERTCR